MKVNGIKNIDSYNRELKSVILALTKKVGAMSIEKPNETFINKKTELQIKKGRVTLHKTYTLNTYLGGVYRSSGELGFLGKRP